MFTFGITMITSFQIFASCLRKGVHTLCNRICATIAKCQFHSQEVKDIMKIMVLQHAMKYHEARDWIHLQDQSTLMYQSFLAHCRQMEARCKQFQQAKAQGRAHLTSMASASASKSSIYADVQSNTKQPCDRCGYNHLHGHCPAFHKKNASTATTPVISPLYLESSIVLEAQKQLHLDTENWEEDPMVSLKVKKKVIQQIIDQITKQVTKQR